ncbi:MAG: helicase, partial [Spirochaetes bacterium]|nr:helicase [Spirochaetota bacterium]
CPEKKFSARVIELCAEGRSVERVTAELTKNYGVYSYGGDLLNYLDGAARALEAVELIAGVFGKEDVREAAKELRKRMEG